MFSFKRMTKLEDLTVQNAAIQLSAYEQHISKQDYEISLVQEILISKLEPQRWSHEYVISFSKLYIWDLAFRFGKFLLGSRNQNLN